MPDQLESMLNGLREKTGHDLKWWVAEMRRTGPAKHGQVVAVLKAEHGMGHGYANMVAHAVLESSAAHADPDQLVDSQYEGKEQLRPILERILAVVGTFGADVEVAPKKAAVSLRRSKQFALVTPATRTRVDLGLNLRGEAPTERLLEAKGMCTHQIRLGAEEEVDDEVVSWLRAAYERG